MIFSQTFYSWSTNKNTSKDNEHVCNIKVFISFFFFFLTMLKTESIVTKKCGLELWFFTTKVQRTLRQIYQEAYILSDTDQATYGSFCVSSSTDKIRTPIIIANYPSENWYFNSNIEFFDRRFNSHSTNNTWIWYAQQQFISAKMSCGNVHQKQVQMLLYVAISWSKNCQQEKKFLLSFIFKHVLARILT